MQDRHGWVSRSVVTAVATSMTVVGYPMVAAAALEDAPSPPEEASPLSDEEVAEELGRTGEPEDGEPGMPEEDDDTATSSPPASKKDESEDEPAPAEEPDPTDEPKDPPTQEGPERETPERDVPETEGSPSSAPPATKDDSGEGPAPKADPTEEPKDRPKVTPKPTDKDQPAADGPTTKDESKGDERAKVTPKPASKSSDVTPGPDFHVNTPATPQVAGPRASRGPAGEPAATPVDVWSGKDGAVMSADWLGYLSQSGMEPSAYARRDIPPRILEVYQEATSTCPGLPWPVLAAVGKVESDHGRNARVSSAGARGPMQFMPATWETFAVDGDEDGQLEIEGRTDSIYSAAAYLCEHGGDDPATLPEALYAYNHSWSYVQRVMGIAERYVDAGRIATEPVDVVELLANPRLTVYPGGLDDIVDDRIDSRVLDLLAFLTQEHDITVVSLQTGHSKYVAGTTSVSNHYHGRAVDIAVIDGEAVSAASPKARALVTWLASLEGPQRPREVGSPFPDLSAQPGHFSDADHQGHLHIGWGAPDGREGIERLVAAPADATAPAEAGPAAAAEAHAAAASPAEAATNLVRRDEMASAIARSLAAGGVTLPEPSDQGFTDLAGGAHDDAINQLAELGVVSGTTATSYSPDDYVRRDQAAALFVRALEVAEAAALPEAASRFADTAGNVHETAIDQAAEAGLTSGTTGATYSPTEPVTGEQRDSLLARLRGLLRP